MATQATRPGAQPATQQAPQNRPLGAQERPTVLPVITLTAPWRVLDQQSKAHGVMTCQGPVRVRRGHGRGRDGDWPMACAGETLAAAGGTHGTAARAGGDQPTGGTVTS
jgi:hypothetical protein